MNKRIKELAQQAGINFEIIAWIVDDKMSEREDVWMDSPENLEKFAELLIENVLEIVENNRPDPDPYSERYLEQEYGERTANDIRDEIKYRFGVSE